MEAPPTPEQFIARLAEQAAAQVVAELNNPGKRMVERRFALGGGLVFSGNTYARQGAFDLAQARYEEAVKADEKDHAAHYNLGLLLEAVGDLPGARKHFETALATRECELYIAAYQRARGGPTSAMARPPAALTPDRPS